MSKKSIRSFLRNTGKILRMVWEIHKRCTVLLCIFTILQSFLPVSHVWVNKLIIDNIVFVMQSGGDNSVIRKILFLVGVELILTIVGVSLRYYHSWILDRLKDLLSQHINMLIVKKSVSLDLSFFESPAFYDQLKNAEAEAGYRPITVLNETFSLIRNIISLIPFVVLLFALNWIIVLIVAMTIVPYFLVQSGNSYAGYLVMRNRAPEGREMSYVKSLLTDLGLKSGSFLHVSRK